MFKDPKNSKPENSKEQNKISAGTIVTGDIKAKGSFRIEGTLEGNLITAGKVVISQAGIINGKLECEQADIEGKISGNLNVSGILSLRSSAVIDGEVEAGKLAIEPGATFNATCQMNGGVKSLKKKNEKQSA